MPLMHSETLADHDLLDEIIGKLMAEGDEQAKHFAMLKKFAVEHREPVAKFGRYPTRN